MNRSGRWGLSQFTDRWESTGFLGYADREDAEAEARRLNTIQPGRWRVRDRRPLTGSCEDDCQTACAYPGQFSECEATA